MCKIKDASVQLSTSSKKFLNELSKLLSFNITVTDGYRTARQQAIQMAETIQEQIFAGQGETLADVYSDSQLANAIQAEWPDTEKMALVIEQNADNGRYISRHLVNDAFDIRTTGGTENQLNNSQIDIVIEKANSIGLKTVLERDHIHVEVLENWVIVDEKKSNLLWLVAIGIGVALWTTS